MRLRQFIESNVSLMNIKLCGISWKYLYFIIIIFVILYSLCFPAYKIIDAALVDDLILLTVTATLGVISDLLTNTLITSLYLKGLHEIAVIEYGIADRKIKAKYGEEAIDSRVHELMLEATRYAVLFVFVWFTSMIFFVTILIVYVFSTEDFLISGHNGGSVILLFAGTIKEITLLIAITLSWKFSHVPYEKICDNKCIKCHSWMQRCCENLVTSSNLENGGKVIKEININVNGPNNELRKPLLFNTSKIELDNFE